MSTLYVLEAANLFVGDHDIANSKHLSLQELKLPMLQAQFQDHHPGGSRVGIEIETGIQKLEPTFKLTGFDASLLTQFGLGGAKVLTYTAYGVITDRRDGTQIELRAVMRGRLGKVEQEAFKRGDLNGVDYAINEVTHYEVWVANEEKLYWDFFESAWRVGGVDQDASANAILRVSQV